MRQLHHKYLILFLVCLTAMAFPQQLMAQLRCPQLFSDHMVLQRDIPISVWGWANPLEKITVSLDGSEALVVADEKGEWVAKLPKRPVGGPYQLTVKGANEQLVFSDVLMGDVWFASGQSNMEHPMAGWPWIPYSGINDYEKEMADVDYHQVRLFQVPKMPMPVPAVDYEESAWSLPSEESLELFSSTAWFFAKQLNQQLNIPIGIIHGSWGGTPIRSWLSAEVATQFAKELDLQPPPENFDPNDWRNAELASLDNAYERRMTISFPKTDYLPEMALDFDDSGWQETNPIDEDTHFENVVWARKEVRVPEKFAKGPFELSLGVLNRESRVYVNGQELGFFLYSQPAKFEVPVGLIKPGKNVIGVRLATPFGVTSFEGDAEAFVLSHINGKFAVSLADSWRFQNDKKEGFGTITNHYSRPTYLYNGMVAPATNYGLKGFIWYQGEADASRAELYGKMFPTMISDWRTKWGLGDLAFLFVQITSIETSHDIGTPNSSWSQLRQVQKETLKLPNTGMAVTIDLGDPYDVHPKNKVEFGRRLALQALDVAYNEPVEANGPSPLSASLEGKEVVVRFSANIELKKNRVGLGASFELAGEDGQFLPATGEVKGNKLYIHSGTVAEPKAVRFDWSNDPEYYIINKAGLPASPFVLELDK
ncbi:MAG: sialate O-acetylesterase [Imperialibacter sp.]|uniref:sialate O-acetylesterase n=1 Tax=Imperialibacter sp. TaxID=2038411 RepID=UPI003A83CC69